MAAKKRHRCVHCLRPGADTEDHGVPKSFYPDNSMPNVPRVKAPSCQACQRRLRLIEEELLIALGMCLDRTDPLCAGVPERVLRSLDPACAKDARDRSARLAARRRLREQSFVPESSVGELPGFGPQGTSLAVKIRGRAVEEFGEKLTRVMYWAGWEGYIEPSHEIRTFIVTRNDDIEKVEAVIRGGELKDVGPGVRIAARRTREDPLAGLVACELWGRFRFYCAVTPRGILDVAPDIPCEPR